MRGPTPRDARTTVANAFRRAFVTGVAVLVPLFVSLLVVALAGRYVYRYLDGFSNYVLGIGPETMLTLATPFGPVAVGKETLIELITPLVVVAVVVTAGLFVNASRFGDAAVGRFDDAVALVPGIGPVYESFRQMSDVMLEEDARNFREVKLVEFPHDGAYTLGFVTTETPDALREPTGHAEMLTLFLPLAPNPVMGGHLVHMPADAVLDVEMSVEEGIRAVVTSGVAVDGGSGADGGLSAEALRNLSGVEHADQRLDPEADSPDVRRDGPVDPERDERWDRQVDPEQSRTAADIARRKRGRDRDDGSGTDPEGDTEPGSLYGAEHAANTPARESGRYVAETAASRRRPAREADRSNDERGHEETRPEVAGDRAEAERDETVGRPDEGRDGGEPTDEDA